MCGIDKFAIFTKKLVIKPQLQGQVTLIFVDSHVNAKKMEDGPNCCGLLKISEIYFAQNIQVFCQITVHELFWCKEKSS